jgi:glutathione synthase/RimK-type ligase-like ATP-grasp enzyme
VGGSGTRVALVTCAEVPDLDPDDAPLLPALADRRISAEPAAWDDPCVDWSAFDLAVLRSTWDYAGRLVEFLAWAQAVPRLANAADVVRWNTDKRYLRELAQVGVPVVPTAFAGPGEALRLPGSGEFVVKPVVSAGGLDTARYTTEESALAAEHIAELHQAGRAVMVQPYLSGVDVAGESALLYLGGKFSHSVRKGALLTGSDRAVEGLYREESISPRTARPDELAIAEQALAVVPGGAESLLYARVDLLPGPDGAPLLLELELTEPSLFLSHATGAVDRLADAVAAAVTRAAA